MSFPFKSPLHMYFASTIGYRKDPPLDLDTCPVSVYVSQGRIGFTKQCGRKPKDVRPVTDPENKVINVAVCGLHVGTYDRALAKYEDEQDRKEALETRTAEVQALADRLHRITGLEFSIEEVRDFRNPWIHRVTGKVRVDAEELLKWVSEQ